MSFPVWCARIRMPVCAAALLLILIDWFLATPWVFGLGLGLLVVGLTLYFRVGTVRCAPVEVSMPVNGWWLPVNSPASRVPSHGVHAYGQTYAIDLAYEPAEGTRPGFGWWPPARRPHEFPGFGQPVFAPGNGRVVRVHRWERDHWSRNSMPGMLYLIVESLRELLGPGRILGNHVVLDLGDGVYALLAHLQRHSIRVRTGDRVQTGQQLGACGNSGNSTEPHVHFQLMDHRNVLIAAGLPMWFTGFGRNGEAHAGVPANGQAFEFPTSSVDTPAGHSGGETSEA